MGELHCRLILLVTTLMSANVKTVKFYIPFCTLGRQSRYGNMVYNCGEVAAESMIGISRQRKGRQFFFKGGGGGSSTTGSCRERLARFWGHRSVLRIAQRTGRLLLLKCRK